MKRADLDVAIGAGLSVALPLYKIFTMRESDGSPNPLTLGEAGTLLFVLVSYPAASSLLRPLRARRIFRLVWLWVPILGSASVAIADYCLGLIYVDASMERAAKEWLFLSLWTLPVASAVHYSGALVRSIRRWHEGPDTDLSILRR